MWGMHGGNENVGGRRALDAIPLFMWRPQNCQTGGVTISDRTGPLRSGYELQTGPFIKSGGGLEPDGAWAGQFRSVR